MTTLIRIVVIVAAICEWLGLIGVAVGACAIVWWLLSLGGITRWVTFGMLTGVAGFMFGSVMSDWQYRRMK